MMKLEKYTAPHDNGRLEEITKVELTNDEWLVFLRNLANSAAGNVETNSQITSRDIDWIDTNRCVPLCANENFVRRYGADTRLLSIVCENYGNIHLRLWLAEHGVLASINKIMEEVFPGGLPDEILANFWEWWNKLPMEPQAVGGRLVTKRTTEFGIGHLSAWIQQTLNEKEPQVAWQRFLYLLRPLMYAHELFLIWTSNGLIRNNGGMLSPLVRA